MATQISLTGTEQAMVDFLTNGPCNRENVEDAILNDRLHLYVRDYVYVVTDAIDCAEPLVAQLVVSALEALDWTAIGDAIKEVW